MSSSNQRPANRGFRSVLRCAISHYRQSPSLSAPEPIESARALEDLNPRIDSGWSSSVSRQGMPYYGENTAEGLDISSCVTKPNAQCAQNPSHLPSVTEG